MGRARYGDCHVRERRRASDEHAITKPVTLLKIKGKQFQNLDLSELAALNFIHGEIESRFTRKYSLS